MTLYDFFQEKILPWFKDDYQEFSSKTVDGYSLYVATWDKTPRQAMITKNAPALLQRIFDKFSASTGNKEAGLQSSQVSRWYVNGFTSAYNYCRRYDLDHPFEHTDFAQWSIKLNSSDDLERGEWDIDMFRKYTINFGRREGTLFYVAEREASNGKIEDKQGELSTGDNNTLPSDVNNEKKLYEFSKGLINELYDRFNGEIFEDLSSVEEFENRRFQHANALTIAKLKNIFIKAFKWTTKIQFFSRTTIYFVCDLSYILMTYIIKRR